MHAAPTSLDLLAFEVIDPQDRVRRCSLAQIVVGNKSPTNLPNGLRRLAESIPPIARGFLYVLDKRGRKVPGARADIEGVEFKPVSKAIKDRCSRLRSEFQRLQLTRGCCRVKPRDMRVEALRFVACVVDWCQLDNGVVYPS